jgi:DNA-binding NtrC family response regulator
MTNEPDQKPKILLIEDDPDGRRSVSDVLREAGYDVIAVDCGRKGIDLFEKQVFDTVLSDIKLTDIDGIQVLKEIRKLAPDIPVLLITAYGTIQSAVEALKAGAYDYILKPLDLTALLAKVAHAIETRQLRAQVVSLKEELFARPIIARSEKMLAVLKEIKTVAPAQTNVLLLGESGTGKELAARALHALSKNAKGPFIAVNCGAFTESLLESELFGHEKGAFTGATQMRQGAFERAHNGTLFLDEVGLASPNVQTRLLRVLEEREIMRVGGSKTISVNVRVIAASNRDLDELVAEKKFRRDLLYRLQVITIRLPPLRERPDDIQPLAEHFINLFCRENGKHIETIAPDFYAELKKYHWPGNVRELRNVIEAAVVLATVPELKTEKLKLPTQHKEAVQGEISLAEIERHAILTALQRHKGNRTLAAEELNISTRTIQRKIKDYNLPF